MNLTSITTQLKSTQNLQRIIGALELTSSIKFQKLLSQSAFFRSFLREYLGVLGKIQGKIALWDGIFETFAIEKKRLIIVISTEKGFVGGLNTKLFSVIESTYGSRKSTVDLFVLGRKAEAYFQKNGWNVVASLYLGENVSSEAFVELYQYIQQAIQLEKYTKIKIYFTYYQNSLFQRPIKFTVFPITRENFAHFLQAVGLEFPETSLEDLQGGEDELVIEPDIQAYKQYIFQYLMESIVYYSVINAKLSEYQMRITHMKNAKDNSKELEKKLQHQQQKLRQATITAEISDIVGGRILEKKF